MQKDAVSRVMREMGRKGGKARLKKMTAEQRSEIAKKAAAASVKVRSKKAKERAAGKKS
jgi:hypothetical protein